jgi:carboxyl-terminal processing protease
MKRNIIIFFVIIFIVGIICQRGNCQKTSVCEQAYDLVQTIKKFHYAPRKTDSTFSKEVFKIFTENLDEDGLLFSAEDIKQLEKHEFTIDDEIEKQECSLVNDITYIYRKKISFADSLLDILKSKKIDFTKKEYFSLNEDENHVSQILLANKWIGYIKLEILKSYLYSDDSLKEKGEPTSEQVNELKKNIINKEKKILKLRISNNGGMDLFISTLFLKAISSAFDPHTDFFTINENNAFSKMLSSETLSFGIQIYVNEEGEIELIDIAPGSPAWNSNKLNTGDVILGVKTPNGKTTDFSTISSEEINQFFDNPKLNDAIFLIKKRNGKKINVKLYKDKISVEENLVKSFVLEGKRKIGYIYLPEFYSQTNDNNSLPNGCANDVAKELIKLKTEKINGLIFDIRNNGGGDMKEAIRLAGIFINFGALGIIQSKGQEPVTLKDIDRGTIYDGPLVILTNSNSASASEFFAGAIQDYNRGLIVGSRTYGKGTAQNILPIEAYKYNRPEEMKTSPQAFVKLTTSLFFRATGVSHQNIGIEPDINIPDIFDLDELRESAYSTSLKTSNSNKKTYYYPLEKLPIEELGIRCQNRIKNDSVFNKIKQLRNLCLDYKKIKSVPLDYKSFKKYSEEINNINIDDINVKNDSYKVKNLSFLKGTSSLTDSKKEINENIMENISKDAYILEAYNITNDIIEINAK